MAKEKQKAPEAHNAPGAAPAPKAPLTPEHVTEGFRDQGSQVISDALPRQDLYALGLEKLRAYFIKDFREEDNGDKTFGIATFHGNKSFEKWIGLKHVIPSQYDTVTVRAPNGETWQGERRKNGSFYTSDGMYIALWEGYTFEASKAASTPVLSTSITPTSVTASSEKNRERIQLNEVSLHETVFVGDSLTVGMRNALDGANFVAEGGKQTGWMVTHMRDFLRERQAGKFPEIKRVVIFGGINDIASLKTPTAIQDNLSTMYREAKAAGLDVIACTIPQWDTQAFIARYEKRTGKKHPLSSTELLSRTQAVNRWIMSQQGLAEGPSRVTDLNKEADATRYPRVRDGLHFTGKASEALAKFIATEGKIQFPGQAA